VCFYRYLNKAAKADFWLSLIVSGIRTAVRLEAYLTESAHHEQVYAFVNENTPKDALIITESEPFWRGNDIGVHPIKRDVVEPGLENVFDKGDYFISHEMAYELMRAGAIRPAPDFLEDRAMALETWDLVLDLGKGRARVRVWRKPN